jgi:hypothetical protein
MHINEVISEIERRIKRLEAEIEFVEQRLALMEKTGAISRYKTWERRQESSVYYLMIFFIWIFLGLLLLIYIKSRYARGIPIPTTFYIIITATLVLFPLSYILWRTFRKEQKESPIDYLESRERSARIVISSFYNPLKDALREGNDERILKLADELLNSPILSEAIKIVNEGDPKLMAYALYLYVNRNLGLEEEIKETLQSLDNRPLKKLLTYLLQNKDL